MYGADPFPVNPESAGGVGFRGAGFQCPQRVQKEANPAALTIYRVEEVWSPFSYAKRVVDC